MELFLEFIKFACSGFWVFIGVSILSYLILNFCVDLISRIFRFFKILLRGWPPLHLNADGEWKK